MGRWSPEVGTDGVGTTSLFEVYDEHLVPLVFRAYADDLIGRLAGMAAGAVLETAAGTGVVTRLLAERLPPEVAITATDLVPGMLERAERVGTARPVTWEVADALDLPYDDESFDVVVCQFGAMFFAPHVEAFAEARRVLRPGGRFLFTVWDRLDRNDFSAVVAAAVKEVFPDDPPGFLERTPYAYNDSDVITADLAAAGFTATPRLERLERPSRAHDAVDVARALCAGTPLRDEIQVRGPGALEEAVERTAARLADRFGAQDLEGRTAAVFVAAVR